MNCTNCKKPTQVKDSRAYENNQVKRRRVCVSCNHSFYTVETRLQEFLDLNKLRRAPNQMLMDTKVPRKTKPAVRRSKQPRTRFDDFDDFDDDDNITLRELGLE
tara:strand:- start:781 stop:1092 length:312 start_codon:yes stop_codon:yes gene_type:complete